MKKPKNYVEEDGFSFATGRPVNQHKCAGVVGKLLPEQLHGVGIADGAVFKQIGQCFQEVRFTTSKEARYPHTHIGGRLLESITVIIEEGYEVLLQFFCDDILTHLLVDNFSSILVDLDNAVYRTVDVILEHFTNHHCASPPYASLNAR